MCENDDFTNRKSLKASSVLWRCNQHWKDALTFLQTYQERSSQLSTNYKSQLELFQKCNDEQEVRQRKLKLIQERSLLAEKQRLLIKCKKDSIDSRIHEALTVLDKKRSKLAALSRFKQSFLSPKIDQMHQNIQIINQVAKFPQILLQRIESGEPFIVDSASICIREIIERNRESYKMAISDGISHPISFPPPNIRSLVEEYPLESILSRMTKILAQINDHLEILCCMKPEIDGQETLIDLQRAVLCIATANPEKVVLLDAEDFQLRSDVLENKKKAIEVQLGSVSKSIRVLDGIIQGKCVHLLSLLEVQFRDMIPNRIKCIKRDLEERLLEIIREMCSQMLVVKNHYILNCYTFPGGLYLGSSAYDLQIKLLAAIIAQRRFFDRTCHLPETPMLEFESERFNRRLFSLDQSLQLLKSAIENRAKLSLHF